MRCYEDGWPLEAMARQLLIDRRSDAKGTRSRNRNTKSKSSKSADTKQSSKQQKSFNGEKASKQDRLRPRAESRKRDKSRQGEKSSHTGITDRPRDSTPPVKEVITRTQSTPRSPPSAGPSKSSLVPVVSRAASRDYTMVCFL